MGRARILPVELHCHSCDRTWRGAMPILDDHMRALHNLNPHEDCNRCEPLHGVTRCKFLPESCTCPTPHVEVIRRQHNQSYATCRSEQRTAVYLMPDGSVSVPASNKFDDDIALAAVQSGGVRHEFPTVRSMQQFQRERQRTEGDEFNDRCMVIDYDQSSILSGQTLLHDRLKQEDEARQRVYDREKPTSPIRVYLGGERYEEARRKAERQSNSGTRIGRR